MIDRCDESKGKFEGIRNKSEVTSKREGVRESFIMEEEEEGEGGQTVGEEGEEGRDGEEWDGPLDDIDRMDSGDYQESSLEWDVTCSSSPAASSSFPSSALSNPSPSSSNSASASTIPTGRQTGHTSAVLTGKGSGVEREPGQWQGSSCEERQSQVQRGERDGEEDVTTHAEDVRVFHAHKVILSQYPFFKAMFTSGLKEVWLAYMTIRYYLKL